MQVLQAAQTLADVRKAAAYRGDAATQATAAPGSGSYRLSKAALNRAVQLLAKDAQLVQASVGVVAVCPGWCRTDMGSQGAPRSAEQGGRSVTWWVDNYEPSLNGLFYLDGERQEW